MFLVLVFAILTWSLFVGLGFVWYFYDEYNDLKKEKKEHQETITFLNNKKEELESSLKRVEGDLTTFSDRVLSLGSINNLLKKQISLISKHVVDESFNSNTLQFIYCNKKKGNALAAVYPSNGCFFILPGSEFSKDVSSNSVRKTHEKLTHYLHENENTFTLKHVLCTEDLSEAFELVKGYSGTTTIPFDVIQKTTKGKKDNVLSKFKLFTEPNPTQQVLNAIHDMSLFSKSDTVVLVDNTIKEWTSALVEQNSFQLTQKNLSALQDYLKGNTESEIFLKNGRGVKCMLLGEEGVKKICDFDIDDINIVKHVATTTL